jgi:hypothetical protein
MDLLARFRTKLSAAKDETPTETVNESEVEKIADSVRSEFLAHTLVSQEIVDNVHDIYTNAELLSVYAPRNPMTKRRREESNQLMREKKYKGP